MCFCIVYWYVIYICLYVFLYCILVCYIYMFVCVSVLYIGMLYIYVCMCFCIVYWYVIYMLVCVSVLYIGMLYVCMCIRRTSRGKRHERFMPCLRRSTRPCLRVRKVHHSSLESVLSGSQCFHIYGKDYAIFVPHHLATTHRMKLAPCIMNDLTYSWTSHKFTKCNVHIHRCWFLEGMPIKLLSHGFKFNINYHYVIHHLEGCWCFPLPWFSHGYRDIEFSICIENIFCLYRLFTPNFYQWCILLLFLINLISRFQWSSVFWLFFQANLILIIILIDPI